VPGRLVTAKRRGDGPCRDAGARRSIVVAGQPPAGAFGGNRGAASEVTRMNRIGRGNLCDLGAASLPIKESNMNRRHFMMSAAAFAAGWNGHSIHAEERNDPALVTSMPNAKITLQQALDVAAQQGQPISAKFEVEDGKLQLSVYTMKDGKFSEMLVNYVDGRVAKTQAITEGDDLAAAKAQSAAMAKAQIDLKTAADKAVGQNAGFRAVSVMPALKDGHAVATVGLLRGEQLKTVDQPLE
jgi:hypothetical protein